MTDGSRDYYEVLRVGQDADLPTIKTAFRNLSKMHHPDKHALASTEEKLKHENIFKLVNEAHETLSDREKRAYYDKFVYKARIREGLTSDQKAEVNRQFYQRIRSATSINDLYQRIQQVILEQQLNRVLLSEVIDDLANIQITLEQLISKSNSTTLIDAITNKKVKRIITDIISKERKSTDDKEKIYADWETAKDIEELIQRVQETMNRYEDNRLFEGGLYLDFLNLKTQRLRDEIKDPRLKKILERLKQEKATKDEEEKRKKEEQRKVDAERKKIQGRWRNEKTIRDLIRKINEDLTNPELAVSSLFPQVTEDLTTLQNLTTGTLTPTKISELKTKEIEGLVLQIHQAEVSAEEAAKKLALEQQKREEAVKKAEQQRNENTKKEFQLAIENAEDFSALLIAVRGSLYTDKNLAQIYPELSDDVKRLEAIGTVIEAAEDPRQFWKNSPDEELRDKGLSILQNELIQKKAKEIYVSLMKKKLAYPKKDVWEPYKPLETPFTDLEDFALFLEQDLGDEISLTTFDAQYNESKIYGAEIAARLKAMAEALKDDDLDWEKFRAVYGRNQERFITYPKLFKNDESIIELSGIVKDQRDDFNIHRHVQNLVERIVTKKYQEGLNAATTFDEFFSYLRLLSHQEIEEVYGKIKLGYSSNLESAIVTALNLTDLRNWEKARLKGRTLGLFGGEKKSSEEMKATVKAAIKIDNDRLIGEIVDLLETKYELKQKEKINDGE